MLYDWSVTCLHLVSWLLTAGSRWPWVWWVKWFLAAWPRWDTWPSRQRWRRGSWVGRGQVTPGLGCRAGSRSREWCTLSLLAAWASALPSLPGRPLRCSPVSMSFQILILYHRLFIRLRSLLKPKWVLSKENLR